jgi:tRNA (cytidine32/uridine32-2'-O)-methyltransferase
LLDARPAAEKSMQSVIHSQQEVAVVFCREDRGLTNEELALANYHVTIPVNSDYGVLNVAQAIQVICYEMRMATLGLAEKTVDTQAMMQVTDSTDMHWDEPLVTHEQMEQFYPHIEKMLAEIEFLDPKNPRLLPLRLRRLFGRIQLDKMEYHLLRGIFSRVQALNNGTWKKSKHEDQN